MGVGRGGSRAAVPVTVRVVLADDQPLVRAGLRVLIADCPDLDVVGEARDRGAGRPADPGRPGPMSW